MPTKMPTNIQEIIDNEYVQSMVINRAYILSQKFHKSLDFEDAKQNIWEAVIKAVNRYNGMGELLYHVLTNIRYYYGNFVRHPEANRLEWYESEISYDFRGEIDESFVNEGNYDSFMGEIDESFEKVEANILLDNIEKTLKKESEKSVAYKLALDWFKLLRKDYTTKEASESLNVSVNYLNIIKYRILKNLVIKHEDLQIL